MAMLELDSCAVGTVCGEANFDLARVVWVLLQLPGGPNVPAEHDPGRWFVDEDAGPTALGAVLGPIDDVATHLWLEHGLGYWGPEQVVLRRLEVAEAGGEHAEGLIDGRVDNDVLGDAVGIGESHG